MHNRHQTKPGIVILDVTKREATALREHMRSSPPARKLGNPEVNVVFVRMVSRLRQNQTV